MPTLKNCVGRYSRQEKESRHEEDTRKNNWVRQALSRFRLTQVLIPNFQRVRQAFHSDADRMRYERLGKNYAVFFYWSPLLRWIRRLTTIQGSPCEILRRNISRREGLQCTVVLLTDQSFAFHARWKGKNFCKNFHARHFLLIVGDSIFVKSNPVPRRELAAKRR